LLLRSHLEINQETIMKKTSVFFATLAMSCSAAAFAQGATGNADMQSNGSMTQPETTGTVASPPTTYNSATPNGTTSDNATPKKSWNKPHQTVGTDPTGTPAQPAGHDTGMAGSGPGVPSNANGMGTTSH
jgi:hypothetical protein